MWPMFYGRGLAWPTRPVSHSHDRWTRHGQTWDRHRATWSGPGFHAQRTVMFVRPERSPGTVEVVDVTPEPEDLHETRIATTQWWDEPIRRLKLAWQALRGEI